MLLGVLVSSTTTFPLNLFIEFRGLRVRRGWREDLDSHPLSIAKSPLLFPPYTAAIPIPHFALLLSPPPHRVFCSTFPRSLSFLSADQRTFLLFHCPYAFLKYFGGFSIFEIFFSGYRLLFSLPLRNSY